MPHRNDDLLECEYMVSGSMAFCGSFFWLCVLLWIGVQIRRFSLVRMVFLPSSLIAGALGLIIRILVEKFGQDDYIDSPGCSSWRIYKENFMSFWYDVPSIAINVVFAAIFLGRQLPSGREAMRMGGPQLMYGQLKAWGSWFWCCIAGIAIVYITDVDDVVVAMFPVGFEGGHGTAAGLQELLGGPEGAYYSLAVTSATVGIILGCLCGTLIVNWGVWRGHLHFQKEAKRLARLTRQKTSAIQHQMIVDFDKDLCQAGDKDNKYQSVRSLDIDGGWKPSEDEPLDLEPTHENFRAHVPLPTQYGDRENRVAFMQEGKKGKGGLRKKIALVPADLYDVDARPIAGLETIRREAIDPLAYQIVHIGLAIGIGYAMVRLVSFIDYTSDTLMEIGLFSSFPLFPFCMIGGMIMEIVYKKTGIRNPSDSTQMSLISGTAIEFLCCTAIATMTLTAGSNELLAFLVIICAGITWQLVCFFVIAQRVLPDCWFERAIVEFGMSFGTTSIGLLLLRMADPLRNSTAWESFSYKQMMHEPFMGGGIWTTFAVILLTAWVGTDKEKQHLGIYIIMGVSLIAMMICLGVFFGYYRQRFKAVWDLEHEDKNRYSSRSLSSFLSRGSEAEAKLESG